MFDLGLSKIFILAIVGLIVLGPERLPKVARVAGALFGRAQRYVQNVKEEVTREMNSAELSEIKDLAQSVKTDVQSAEQQIRQSWQEANDELQQGYASVADSVMGKNVDNSGYQNALAIARARRTGRASWGVKLGKTPQWYKAQQRLPKRVRTEAARMLIHRPHQKSTRPRGFF